MVPDMWAIKLGKTGQSKGGAVIPTACLQKEGIGVRPQEAGRVNVGQLGAHFWISYLEETCKSSTWGICGELHLGLFPCSVGLWRGSDLMTACYWQTATGFLPPWGGEGVNE